MEESRRLSESATGSEPSTSDSNETSEQTVQQHAKHGRKKKEEDIERYHELGLGRGINVTDPDMWRNKSAFLVRKVSVDPEVNIITTDECSRKEAYTKEVTSFEAQRHQIQLSLEEPVSRVKIGMDAEYSQSTSSSKTIAGMKCETKTLSFKSDFIDIPLNASMDFVSLEVPSNIESSDNDFERKFYSWLFGRIHDSIDKIKSIKKDTGAKSSENPNSKDTGAKSSDVVYLTTLLKVLIELEVSTDANRDRNIECVSHHLHNECMEFLGNLGMTHYVSAIKLGAMKYRETMTSSKRKGIGGGAEIGVQSTAKAKISEKVVKGLLQKEQQEHHIGELNPDDSVKEEAVIGFQIQPIDALVRVQFIQRALRRAIKEYIQSKTDKCQGPFLISGKVGDKTVYWTVDEKHENNEKKETIMGTPFAKSASLFYIKPAEDPSHPSNFFILYYGKGEFNKKILTHITDPYVKSRQRETPLPRYLVADTNFLGFSDKQLELKMAAKTSQALFSLHRRVQSSFACLLCGTTDVDMFSWLEGEQFYVRSTQHALKLDSFIAMVSTEAENKTVSSRTNTQAIKSQHSKSEK